MPSGNLGVGGSVLSCALGWAGWGHLKLYWSISEAFGVSDWLVMGSVLVI